MRSLKSAHASRALPRAAPAFISLAVGSPRCARARRCNSFWASLARSSAALNNCCMGAPPSATICSSIAIRSSLPGTGSRSTTKRRTVRSMEGDTTYFMTLPAMFFLNAGEPLIFWLLKAVATASVMSRKGAMAARYRGLRYVSSAFMPLFIALHTSIARPICSGVRDANISCMALPPSVLVLNSMNWVSPPRLATKY